MEKGGYDETFRVYEPNVRIVEYEARNGFAKSKLVHFEGDGNYAYVVNLDTVLLEPAFWIALGKARGWSTVKRTYFQHESYDGDDQPCNGGIDWEPWQYHCHRFIDHLAKGHDAESFFLAL